MICKSGDSPTYASNFMIIGNGLESKEIATMIPYKSAEEEFVCRKIVVAQ